jgi:hypothetical protein
MIFVQKDRLGDRDALDVRREPADGAGPVKLTVVIALKMNLDLITIDITIMDSNYFRED